MGLTFPDDDSLDSERVGIGVPFDDDICWCRDQEIDTNWNP